MQETKHKTIKFRRYSNVDTEETLVGGFICEAITTLGTSRKVGRLLPRCFPGSTYIESQPTPAYLEEETNPFSYGKSVQESE